GSEPARAGGAVAGGARAERGVFRKRAAGADDRPGTGNDPPRCERGAGRSLIGPARLSQRAGYGPAVTASPPHTGDLPGTGRRRAGLAARARRGPDRWAASAGGGFGLLRLRQLDAPSLRRAALVQPDDQLLQRRFDDRQVALPVAGDRVRALR